MNHATHRSPRRTPRNQPPASPFVPKPPSRCANWRTSCCMSPTTLTPGERELIATYVSSQNDCYFCQTSHGAAAAATSARTRTLVNQVKHDFPGRHLRQTQGPSGHRRQGAARRQECHFRKRAAGPKTWRNRSRDPRHRADRCRILHVQPLRGRTRDLAATRSSDVRHHGTASG